MSAKDGGAAFPRPATPGAYDLPQYGMSLRDYFAAKAMQALVSATDSTGMWMGNDLKTVPDQAYAMADAMLAVRAKGMS